ncbi:Cytochrome c, mono- and diheme variants [Monaibacterium marinum]|uniref:Cytochrome c, mono- and diheme variants n=1 Tax=Pontivivens marinum TaxID=1690039 RepID=A0A2C9CT03_9RHOB|nr:cytochrome c [Monaibacterium marinum]SOH94330.1 Cytochrome c, mono- and diheme variants [Monaibacterium marinum]
MIKRIFWTITATAAVGVVGFGVYAYKPAMDPVAAQDRPAFGPEVVEQGRILAAAGYCSECHTTADGAPYAGNYAMETGFGTIYASNLTPAMDTGIGAYSVEAFRRAMKEGVDIDGRHLFPAFPYDHFAKMSDEDVDAIYAYIMTEVVPVEQETRENELPFPLNQRFLQAGWKLLFVDFDEYAFDDTQSEDWNRGAYLAEGVAHCGACHTPRNPVGAEIASDQYGGAQIDGWTAPALTADNASAVPWSTADFKSYLTDGVSTYHGISAGPMGPVVHAGIRELPDEDINALSVYLGERTGGNEDDPATSTAIVSTLERGRPDPQYRRDAGERLYATACASCHYNTAQIEAGRPDLGINSATNLDTPENLIHVILDGVSGPEGIEGVVMPGFRDALSTTEITAIAAYLRDARAGQPAWPDLSETVSRMAESAAHAE